ncbi:MULTISPECIES: YcxB family protein [Brevundimonas]|uniref:YcxB family protein n=1 Tax=Brevundimonas TaxID=41275 RepID=UPI0025BE04A8|nr:MULTISPECIES: YcxB family protein [Brevundimonas]
MTAVIEVRGVQPTPKEGRAAVKAWPVVRRWADLPVLFLGGAMLATIAICVGLPLERTGWIVGLQLVGLYGFIGLSALAHYRVMAAARRSPIAQKPTDWRIDDSGLALSGADFETRIGWRNLVAVVEERDRLIFAASPNTNFILPLHVMETDQRPALRVLIADVRARGVLGAGVD